MKEFNRYICNMKKIVIMMMMAVMTITGLAEDIIQPSQQVTIPEDCYGTIVPETLDKLREYINNDNFDMFSTFFKFGYATYLDKDMQATVVKVQGDKVLVKLENHMKWWVPKEDLQHPK